MQIAFCKACELRFFYDKKIRISQRKIWKEDSLGRKFQMCEGIWGDERAGDFDELQALH